MTVSLDQIVFVQVVVISGLGSTCFNKLLYELYIKKIFDQYLNWDLTHSPCILFHVLLLQGRLSNGQYIALKRLSKTAGQFFHYRKELRESRKIRKTTSVVVLIVTTWVISIRLSIIFQSISNTFYHIDYIHWNKQQASFIFILFLSN